MKRFRARRPLQAAIIATAVLLPTLGMTSASAKQETPRTKAPPTAQATKALSDRILNENLKAAADGRRNPTGGGRNDCDEVKRNLKKYRDQGIDAVSCIQPRDPSTVDPSVLPKFLADLNVKMAPPAGDIPMANFPAASGSGAIQANNLKPWDAADANLNPVSSACTTANVRDPAGTVAYNNRKDGCLVYYFDHFIVRTGSAQVLGVGNFITVEWAFLAEALNRVWDHKVAIAMYAADGLAVNGIWTWMNIASDGQAEIISTVPADTSGQLLRVGQTWWGEVKLLSLPVPGDLQTTTYSRQTFGVVTFSGFGDNVAVGAPLVRLDRVRCDNASYILQVGCVYGAVTGKFVLSRSDPNAKDSILFIERTQNFLPTHPGRAPNTLTRATPIQTEANRKVSEKACIPVRGTLVDNDCDEYPFASTLEGAASGPRYVNWDIALVLSGHNRRVGGLLIAFYNQERMFWGDKFSVVIVP
jgi:hypothetical protein